MRNIKILPIILLISYYCNCQTILNGDFEDNLAIGCSYNNSNDLFNSLITNVHAFGLAGNVSGFVGEVDLQTKECSVNPQSGDWCIGLAAGTQSATDGDMISLELTSDLSTGQSYQLSFYIYGNNSNNSNINIGLSNNYASFGTMIYSVQPESSIWKHVVFDFIPTETYGFITVGNTPNSFGWVQIDNFELEQQLGITDFKTENIVLAPNPFSSCTNLYTSIKLTNTQLTMYNSLGQEVKKMDNIYDNSIQICRDNLPNGIYIIKIENNNKVVSISKVIISN